jgi:hypothetical protein
MTTRGGLRELGICDYCKRGDIIAYWDKKGLLMHSQTVTTDGETKTFGANNLPLGKGGTESGIWAISTADRGHTADRGQVLISD